MEPERPQWLTKDFIKNALRNGNDYTIEIDELKINRPVPKGENYASNIYGAFVQYRKSDDLNKLNEISLIIKAPIEGPGYEATIKSGAFKKESVIYHELSKKFNLILGELGNNDIMPEAYPSSVENILILEDLKAQGYVVADRLKRYDYDHCVVSLKGLAKFHALSALLHDKEPEFVENLGKEIFHNPDTQDRNAKCMASNFTILASILKNLPVFEKYWRWFEVTADHAYELIINSLTRNDDDFNVLNHGDFWVTNVLIKYDENLVPLNVKLIDFPNTRYGSPALDFWNFIDGSAKENVRTEKFDDLINVYLNELNSFLELLGSEKRLEISDFKKSLKRCVNFRICTTFLLLPLIVADPNEVKTIEIENESLENLESSDANKNPIAKYYKNTKYTNLLKKRLEELEECGVIITE